MAENDEEKRKQFYERTMGQLDEMLNAIKKNPDDQMELLRYAKGLVNTITIFGMSGDPEGIALVIIRFRALVEEHGHIDAIQNQFATALANSMSYLMKKQKFEQMYARLEELRIFARAYPMNMTCQRQLAGGLVNSIINFGQRGMMEPVKQLIRELLILSNAHKENMEIQLALAKGLVNSMGYLSKNYDYDSAIPLLDELMALTEDYPNDEDFILQRANGIVTAMSAFSKDEEYIDVVDELNEELSQMAKMYPNHEGVQLRAKTKSLGRD
ncbi:MAG: hypothetical protein FK733_03300 [Asgard group archaeon]|nr:hypothetical protein [Asgard group archaeon]